MLLVLSLHPLHGEHSLLHVAEGEALLLLLPAERLSDEGGEVATEGGGRGRHWWRSGTRAFAWGGVGWVAVGGLVGHGEDRVSLSGREGREENSK